MKSSYKRLGDYIKKVERRNRDSKVTKLRGLSMTKEFRETTSNTVGTDMSVYKVMTKWQFACDFMSVIRVHKFPVVLKTDDEPNLVSPAYPVFEVNDPKELYPEYLMMWFRRSEFDRYADFKCDSAIRGGFDWDALCECMLPIPSIEKQQEIVREYNVIQNRIALNDQLITKLEQTAQAIYKQWFVDFEFPDENGKPYKSNGGKMVFCEELEKEIPDGWSIDNLSAHIKYSDKRINIDNLVPERYISTENMLQNKKGIAVTNEIPNITTVTKFVLNDILISNIRPYLKKIWFADFEGGCSNDVLCIKSLNQKNSYFIYYTLEQDSFFNYVMAGSKGTKMPRGDKQWIMDYKIAFPDFISLNKFSEFSKKSMNFRKVSEDENQKLEELKELLLAKMTRVESEVEL